MQDIEGNIIGIDLGTTNSLVAVIEGTDPVIIPNAEGANKTPSVVAFMDEGEIVVGEIARRQAATNPARTITSIKRLMGRNFTDVQESNEKYPFVITDKDNQLFIDIDGMGYRPHQISALILQKLKESAEKFFKEPVSKAIITVPAYFDDLQRTDTKEAARLAGLEVLRLVNEPTAAAMAYGLGKRNEEIVTVYDFGGGTFDISILDIDNNAFEVIVSNGDTHLGGDDLDNALLFWIVEEFKKDYGVDLTEDPITLHRLREVAEKAKCELSTATQTLISLPFVGYRDKKPLHLEKMIRRGEFEDLIQPFVDRTIECCRTALEEAGIGRREISKAILVGGCSRIPMVQDVVEDFFGLSPYKGVNLDEIVALGAATQAGIFSGKLQEVVLLDITPHSLGVEVKDRKVSRIIEKNSTIPIKAAKTFTTTEDNQTFVNIHVVQGEKEDVMDNRSLGKFTLSDIEPSSAGIPRVRITFFIDADGVLEIGAQDLASGQEKNLTITHSFLTGEERQKRRMRKPRMVRDLRKKGKARDETGTGIISGVKLEPQTLPTLAPAETGGFYSTFRIVREDSSEASPIAKGPAPAATAPPAGKKEESPTARKESPVSPDKEQTGQEPPTPPPGKLPIDTQFEQEVRERLNQEETGEEALEVYDRFAGEISELIEQEITLPPEVFLILARIHTLKGSVQEALGAVANYREDIESDPEEALAVVSFIQQRFPDHTHVLMEKAELCHRTGKFKEALKTLEKLQKRDHSDRVVDRLEMLYHDILEKKPDPLVKFKLVKIYLKKNKLDEAIKILQDLTEIEEYRNRALKILGLTYWQKKIYALAWHNFKRLPPNPEIVDILYRIAMDIEKTGDLNVARDIYKRITDESPDYKDVSARFKKIDYRLQLQLKEAASQKPSRSWEMNGLISSRKSTGVPWE